MKDSKEVLRKKQDLIERVKEEALKLREFATKKELSALDFDKLDPEHQELCIYGQMTGLCFSERASELIRNCCEKVYASPIDIPDSYMELNGKLHENITGYGRQDLNYYSPIELFIAREAKDPEGWTQYINHVNGNSKALIDYLKGKTQVLQIKMW